MGGGISKKVHAEEIEKREAKVAASLIEPEEALLLVNLLSRIFC